MHFSWTQNTDDMTKLILTTIVLCLFTVVYGGDNNHAVAKVKKGENVEKLLKRHLLTPHNCNLETFTSPLFSRTTSLNIKPNFCIGII